MLTIRQHGLGFTVIMDGKLIQTEIHSGGCRDELDFLIELQAELAGIMRGISTAIQVETSCRAERKTT